jgi:hypothetical protein
MTARDGLIAIAGLLAPDQPEVAHRATAAHDDPAGYVQRHAARLDNRGITEPVPILPWIALIDALRDYRLVAEIDWKEGPEEVVRALRGLRSSPRDGWDWFGDDERFHVRTEVFLRMTAENLRPTGVSLSSLDIDSDCCPLVLPPAARTTELNNLAKFVGYRVFQFSTES